MARLQQISVCILIVLSSYYPRLTVSQSTVSYLPGFSGPLPFRLETGYVGVGDLEEHQLFYYFVESEKSPKEDPLVLWLLGGPGCSGWSALVYEIGPLYFENVPYNGSLPTLKLREHSWTKISNIIFVDSPVWTGFSYSSGSKDYLGGDIKSSKEVHQFLRKSTKKSCRGDYTKPSNFKCSMDLEAVNKCIAGIYTDHILEPNCPLASPKPKDTVGHGRSLKENSRELLLPDPLPTFGCRGYWYLLSYYWADDASVRKALHIREGTVGEWLRCNRELAYVQDVNSSVKYHLNLTTRGYRALIYSGDHSLSISFVGTETWIRSLNFSIVDDWRPWAVDGQVAGYTRTYSNDFTFATVKGAGHTAPEYKPKECFAMLHRWISHNPL
ncbi:serine carboxypeptidase-like 18 isoform X2 [Magnolia sinica]|uniref:serine carboxypeptidase-like 18 isoform X2 n=1 Tax=Magnolia sinica TaxID=86752 RepID=UPI00265AAFD9|nr:serine carboxypeptidase-like 18 isoform X2 [Magnolia sinica]